MRRGGGGGGGWIGRGSLFPGGGLVGMLHLRPGGKGTCGDNNPVAYTRGAIEHRGCEGTERGLSV